MSVISHDELTVTFRGNEYRFLEVGIDISNQFDKPIGTVLMTHEIEGFEVPLFLVEETDDAGDVGFFFGVKVGQTGLFVTLQDERIIETANELVFHVAEMEGWE